MSPAVKRSRREILKTFTVLTASSALLGRNWIATVLAQVSPATSGGVLRLRVSDYPALQQAEGSVRIGTSELGGTISCPVPVGLFKPILINRGSGDDFFALDTACSHEGCVVPAYNAVLGFSRCPNHGSRYAIDGTCLLGPLNGPPIDPLISYNVRYDGVDTLTVELTDPWVFEFETVGVLAGSPGRIALRFAAFELLEYEIHHRATLTDVGTVVPFSTTPSGPANQTVFVGQSGGGFPTLYVDRVAPAGFYQVAMRTWVV